MSDPRSSSGDPTPASPDAPADTGGWDASRAQARSPFAPEAVGTEHAVTPAGPGPQLDVPEISSLPDGVRPDLIESTTDDDGAWRKVPKAPSSVIDTAPVEDAGVPGPPPIPRTVKIVGAAAIAGLLFLSTWIGLALGTPPPATPAPPTPTIKDWPLDPPQMLESWVRGTVESVAPVTEGGPTVVRADYADGTDRIFLVLSRPESDIGGYLADAGVESTHEVASATCGISVDTNKPVCVRIVDRTAILLVGTTEQSQDTLASQVSDFYDALSG